MKKKSFAKVASLLVAGCVLGVSAFAQDGLSKRIDVTLSDADLYFATQLLTAQTGIQFVIEPGDKDFAKINISLKDKTAEEAIRYICDAAGAHAERDESGVFIIRRGKKVTAPEVPVSTAAPVVIRKVVLQHADAAKVLQQIAAQEAFDPIEGFRELQAMQELYQSKSKSSEIYIVGSGPIPGQAFPVSNQPGSFEKAARGTSDMNSVDSDVRLPGDEAAKQAGFGGRGGGGGGGGQGNGFGGGGGGQPGGGAGGQGGQNGGQGSGSTITAGQGFAPQGLDRVTFDPTDNSLVVQGTEEAIRKLRNLVDLFDVAPKQVEIKVEFIQTSIGVAKSLGFDWLYQRGGVSAGNRPGTFARAGDPIFLNYATGNVTTRMRTFITESDGKTVNAPLIRTLNNQSATVFQQTTTYIFVSQVTGSAGGNIVTFTPQPININTFLSVKPRINADGFITMILQPNIGDQGQIRRGPDGTEVADSINQGMLVTARVRSGRTIALGGITRKQFTNTMQKFPVLGDLPIIGQFFRSTTKNRNDTETIIFVTPTIIDEDGQPGLTP
ncbi:MAG: hypothetical protein JNJ45_08660 [Chthonomonas sp.]|nr:hypothetical protein [Chthonomonas sp.]